MNSTELWLIVATSIVVALSCWICYSLIRGRGFASRWDLRKKIVVICSLQMLAVASVLLVYSYYDAKEDGLNASVDKARSIVLNAEATREEMSKKWTQGIFSAEVLSQWAKEGKIDRVVGAVPVVSAWHAAMAKSKEAGYTLRVPKFDPRNSDNTPDETEARILKRFESEALAECFEIDKSHNAVRFFRPIRLTQECMLCHGDPAQSHALWGNDQGLDPTGAKMENWKVGDVHGAFEIVQSLDAVDKELTANAEQGGLFVGLLVLVAAVLTTIVTTHSVVRPVQRILKQLYEGSNQVNSASGQVASSSQSLAQGASEQAAALEETTAAMEEMSSMTKRNAETAEQASTLADDARKAAEVGNQSVARMSGAIDDIQRTAKETAKIIRVIDEIAFQTNLLALNAAVEAARAGEAGRGFAVVAEEVRSLAIRSAEAAKNTSALIDESVQASGRGATISTEVATALQQITGGATRVSAFVGEIAAASREQALGISQVNTALSQMDAVTQSNAASAEQSAAAAEELSSQASSMNTSFGELVSLTGSASESKKASEQTMASSAR
jgi:methyl-accepting chemotaxis protein